jgi:large subunit ribosomal protein L10
MEGKVLGPSEAQALATLDSRDVMLSKIAGMLKSEMTRAASMFQALQSRFLGVLEAYREKLTPEEVPAPEAAAPESAAESVPPEAPTAEAGPEADTAEPSESEALADEPEAPSADEPEAPSEEAVDESVDEPVPGNEPGNAGNEPGNAGNEEE